MNKKLYQYYEDGIVKAIQDLRNHCITAICVMVSDGMFNGPDGKPADIMLRNDNGETLYIAKWHMNEREMHLDSRRTLFKMTSENYDEPIIYSLDELPTTWLYEVYRYISRSF